MFLCKKSLCCDCKLLFQFICEKFVSSKLIVLDLNVLEICLGKAIRARNSKVMVVIQQLIHRCSTVLAVRYPVCCADQCPFSIDS